MSNAPLNVICIEPRFPGRLGGVADWLVRRRGYRVQFFCQGADPRPTWPEATGRGLEVVAFGVGGLAKEERVEWQRVLERSLCYSYGCWEVLSARHPRPVDLILGRSNGLGSSLFANVELPAAPVVQFYDTYFDPVQETPVADDPRQETYRHWRKAANAIELVELENGGTPWTASEYQRGLFPPEYRQDFQVLFDGVDTRNLVPRDPAPFVIDGKTIDASTKVITFVARSLDALRGFDVFCRLLERLVPEIPNLVAIAVGSPVVDHAFDHAHYGRDFPATLRSTIADSAWQRLAMPGFVTQANLGKILARSDLHVYLSRPHPVSRSLAQAMAAGCVVLGLDHLPVREFLQNESTGLLVRDDLDEMTTLATKVLSNPARFRPLGDAAAVFAQSHLSRDVTLPRLTALFDRLVAGRR